MNPSFECIEMLESSANSFPIMHLPSVRRHFVLTDSE